MSKRKHQDKTFVEYCRILEQGSECDEAFIRIIEKIINENPCNYSRIIQTKKYEKLKDWVLRKTAQITDLDVMFNTRIYMAMHGISSLPTCKTCGKAINVNIINIRDGFLEYCDPKCANLDPEVRQRFEESCLRKFGVKNPSSLPEVRAKVRATCLETLGVDNPAKSGEVIKKIKRSKLEKYGDENYNNPEKNKRTCLDRYGVEYVTQTDAMKSESKRTCLDRYGVENAGGAPEVLEKIKNSNLERHGVEYPQQSPEIWKKTEASFMEKLGVKTPFLTDKVKKMNSDRTKLRSYENFILNNAYDTPCFSADEYMNRTDESQEFEFRCKKCGKVFRASHHNGAHKKCPLCFPTSGGTSIEEHDLAEFISVTAGCEILEHDRNLIKPYEIDVYVPDKKLAFEFDGIYWHSLEYKEKTYHLTKTDMCERHGVRLIHVFENEWLYKNEIVKSRIKNLLGKNDSKIFARKCEVREISPAESFAFQEANHIQGGVYSKVNVGIFSDRTLVGVMTFSKPRFSKKYQYELVRFCTKTGVSITGGASKMLSYFEKHYSPESILSYADRRWSSGRLYDRLGFSLVCSTEPAVFYFKKGSSTTLYNRMVFQKHKLKEMLENYDDGKTELENMLNNGYGAIYDCGNLVYAKTLRKDNGNAA